MWVLHNMGSVSANLWTHCCLSMQVIVFKSHHITKIHICYIFLGPYSPADCGVPVLQQGLYSSPYRASASIRGERKNWVKHSTMFCTSFSQPLKATSCFPDRETKPCEHTEHFGMLAELKQQQRKATAAGCTTWKLWLSFKNRTLIFSSTPHGGSNDKHCWNPLFFLLLSSAQAEPNSLFNTKGLLVHAKQLFCGTLIVIKINFYAILTGM